MSATVTHLSATRVLFRAVWPIDDVDMTLADLQADALSDLPDMLWEHAVIPVGDYRWRVQEQDDGRTFLVLDVESRPWSDPRRKGRRP